MRNRFYLFLSMIILLTTFLLSSFSHETKNQTFAIESQQNERNVDADMSIFIRHPIYSTFYNDSIYFIDSFDGLLKIYDTSSATFKSEYLDISSYSKIVDATTLDNFMFILAEKNDIRCVLRIDLSSSTLELKELTTNLLTTNYNKIFVQKATVETAEMFLISLTSSDFESSPPFVLFVNKNHEIALDYIVEFSNESSVLEEIKDSLSNLLTIQSENDPSKFHLIYIHGASISFSDISLSTIKNPINPINACTSLFSSLSNQNQDVDLNSIDFIEVEEKSYFLVTYNNIEKEREFAQLYDFAIGTDATNTKFNSITEIDTYNNKYLVTNNSYLVYPFEQTIVYKKINYDSENDKFSTIETNVKNPIVDVVYYEENDFVYMSTSIETPLLQTPWNSEEIIFIPENYDIISIGYAKIQTQNTKINDYAYCLFTYDNKNYKGYVKLSDTTNKEVVDIKDYEFKGTVTVYDGTKLYSAPTKVIGDTITDTVFSSVLLEIKSNVRVEILNTICNYTANNSKMVHVKINDSVGYIDCKNIIEPSNQNEFIITNACVSKDKTAVYRDANSKSQIDDYLAKNKMVRVDGARDTKTGFTHITYNDEYGNVLEGYIATDYIETDSWSTLQIIGCILIAINIGLLILILIFKKNYIGGDGQKYVNSKKANYKENN